MKLTTLAALALVTAPDGAASSLGDSQSCLSNRAIRAKTLSAEQGYFARTAQGWWRNTGPACAAYRPDRALRTFSYNDRQCSGDVVAVFDQFSRIDYGNCVLGKWERVAAPAAANKPQGR